MLKKIDKAKNFITENVSLFRCPICHNSFVQKEYALVCTNNHRFDLSKKGTLYFLKTHIQTEYDHQMFVHRQAMIKSGMYEKMLTEIVPYMNGKEVVLDVGCGEGSFLTALSEASTAKRKIGFDISKEGIYLATNQQGETFWCAADLTNLPFADRSVDCILNIFSPSHYKEFERVLQPDGQVVKIIPEAGYLNELRTAFFPNDKKKQTYSNQKVIDKFSEAMKVMEDKRITTVFDIPKERRLDLLEMSPLEWQADPKIKEALRKHPLEKITVDLRMLVGEIR
jgi:23S rRNA (guanine745-N1)-methyltransferase